MLETLAELPPTGDQVGLFKAQPGRPKVPWYSSTSLVMAIARHPVISRWNQWFRFAALLADALRADEALHGDVATPVDEGLGELPARALVNSTRTHITAVRNGGLGER